ncbi:D-hexose-6-phosphate mutarotase [Chitinolyticbacter albus]|uniref:D-hexose-6-phosphate mutarotase n=1 Tax=Chitinolyticbacter albus TaxID=2961951 RepID=UPI00210B0B9F|nr:D-hexose-6-phosphate mutarotase [Chitinolyticbacter albus]
MTQLSAFDSRLSDVTGVSIVNSGALYGGEGVGLPLIVVDNALGRAVLTLQGAHLVSFVPKGGADLLWLSPKATFNPGKAVRGGIPLCLPWFGGHPDGKPAHGFARSNDWQLGAAETLDDGSTRLTLTLVPSDATRALWEHDFAYTLTVTVGRALTLALDCQHKGDVSIRFASAFHTYFAVPDVATARIGGLEGATYINTIGGANSRHQQDGVLVLDGPTDRVYLDVPAVQTIANEQNTIRIDSDTRSAVVWNPWDHAAKMADVGEGNHVGFVCVERGDVFDNAIELAPGASYRVSMTLSA